MGGGPHPSLPRAHASPLCLGVLAFVVGLNLLAWWVLGKLSAIEGRLIHYEARLELALAGERVEA